ncbi:MAG TPA: serine/threonine protein kinase [Leucothrix mucor]|uniref:Serine/threonine protein kinase n=1 Tax=Leucothrix mucor TaxID=45248 RepID=A0A7V2T3H3_LEUMU|nr:serine/threonine protein kinase [Leucothrix mucor]
MSYSFVLIEQDDKMSQQVETIVARCFSFVYLKHIRSEFINPQDALEGDLDCSEHDIILLDCSVSLAKGVEQLQRIKRQTSKPSVLLFSDQEGIKQAALENNADSFFQFQGEWADLSAKIEALLNLRNHLSKFPFQLNDWCLLEVLHNSKNSAVYKAIHRDGKLAAIKRYKYKLSCLDEDFIEQFLSDLDNFSKIKTPRLVQIYDSGISDHVLYQIMELMTQGSLRESLNSYKRLPLPHALTWFFEIVYALHIVHEAGLLHRDLKTANIMLRDDGSLALNDYGIATSLLVKAGFMSEDEIQCTPYYISPERALDEPSGVTSDIYSLGIIFYELLMGEKPYNGSTEMELLMQHVMAPIPILPEEYAGYQSLLNKMLAKNENLRLQRVIDVGSYLSG